MPHSVEFGRIVYTYLDTAGVPLGAITGYEKDKCFFIEHIMVFPHAPHTTLLRMVASGLKRLAESDIGFRSATVYWLKAHPLAAGLAVLAERCGFTQYHEDETTVHWARWR